MDYEPVFENELISVRIPTDLLARIQGLRTAYTEVVPPLGPHSGRYTRTRIVLAALAIGVGVMEAEVYEAQGDLGEESACP